MCAASRSGSPSELVRSIEYPFVWSVDSTPVAISAIRGFEMSPTTTPTLRVSRRRRLCARMSGW